MNHLWEAESLAIPNIVHPQVDSQGAGRPVLRQRLRRRRVKAVTAIPYWAGEAYGYYFTPGVDLSDSTQFPQENVLYSLAQNLLACA